MLASTVQFSTYDQTPTRLHRQTRTSPRGQRRYDRRSAPTRDHGTRFPGSPAPSGPNSVPTTGTHHPNSAPHTPREACRTGSPRHGPAELVSVPPSSTASDTSGHPDWATVTARAQLWTTTRVWRPVLLRKEVIQPHLPVRLPCYDFVPIADPAFDGSLPQGVGPPASGVTDFRDVTGGVYKARERIHRSVADLRLLATPTSWGRVADPNPN
jgi:hypothetical protein